MRILLVFLVALGLASPAVAQSDADRTAVQSVIEGQLQAFLHDDADAAYSFAAPGIKAMFPTADTFMRMVAEGYPPVYRPQSHRYLDLVEKNGSLEQDVEIVDGDGVVWTAIYTLEREPDGTWKISGCYLVKKPGGVA